MDKKEIKEAEKIHVSCICKKCGQKMFECDYTYGEFTIEMKCTRCTRVLTAKGMNFERIRSYATNGKARIRI